MGPKHAGCMDTLLNGYSITDAEFRCRRASRVKLMNAMATRTLRSALGKCGIVTVHTAPLKGSRMASVIPLPCLLQSKWRKWPMQNPQVHPFGAVAISLPAIVATALITIQHQRATPVEQEHKAPQPDQNARPPRGLELKFYLGEIIAPNVQSFHIIENLSIIHREVFGVGRSRPISIRWRRWRANRWPQGIEVKQASTANHNCRLGR